MTIKEKQNREVVSLVVPSHPKFLYVVRSALYPVIIEAGFTKRETRKIILAVDEACSNIIRHAYAGDSTRSIAMTVILENGEVRIELKDTGRKVDVSTIAPRELADIRPGGLGTHFINSVFDSVTYDTSMPEGTILTLTKKRPIRPNA